AISSITIHEVGRPVGGVIIRARYLSCRDRPAIGAYVEIQKTVMVIVSQRRGCHSRLTGSMGREGLRRNSAMPMPILEEEQRLTGREDKDQILRSIIANIRKQRHGRGVKDIPPSLFADVLKAAITQISEKAIGQPSGLTHIEILQAVTVIISHSYALMAV